MNKLTLNLGLRWDRAAASLGAASVTASPVLPSLLPAVTATPVDNAIVMQRGHPTRRRDLRAERQHRKTHRARQLRDVRLAAECDDGRHHLDHPVLRRSTTTRSTPNGNKIADPNEILYGLGDIGYYGFDPLNPTRLTTINQIGKYKTPRTQEFMFGMDHELTPNFGISGTFTYRYFNNFNWQPRSA